MERTKDQQNFKLTPQDYKEKLASVQLKSINLESFSAQVNRDKLSGANKVIINDKRIYTITENGVVVFSHYFELINTIKTKKDFGAKICCSYSLNFSSNLDLDNDFWDIFSAVNLHVNTWPYFREFVQNTTQRMSLPPMTLPLMK